MRRSVIAGGVLVAASSAFGQVIYNNGPLATPNSPNGFCLPANSVPSEVQPGNITAGYNISQTAIAGGYRCADDFVVPAGQTWNVTGVRLPIYQTGSVPPTINNVWLRFWNQMPNAAGTGVIAGDLATNRFASSSATNVYRFFNAQCGTTRQVGEVNANLAVALPAGTYWVEWSALGTGASGPWAPNVTIEGQVQKPGSNALQWTGASYVAVVENQGVGPAQDMCFELLGTVVGGCYPDCDGNGSLTIADFGCFQTKFVQNDPYADCDGNGSLTIADFGCFQTKFVQGCP